MSAIYEGKAKRVIPLGEDKVILEFKDDLTAFDGAKHDVMADKGALNAAITAKLFKLLEERGIPTHFIEWDGCRRITCWKLEMIPLEFIVRNIAWGSLVKRMPLLKKGTPLKKPVFEVHYKSDELHDPLLTLDDVVAAGIMTEEELEKARNLVLRINEELKNILEERGLILVDFKVELGYTKDGRMLLADELTPDTMRLLDKETGRQLDKDLYRRGEPLEKVREAYVEVARRLGVDVEALCKG